MNKNSKSRHKSSSTQEPRFITDLNGMPCYELEEARLFVNDLLKRSRTDREIQSLSQNCFRSLLIYLNLAHAKGSKKLGVNRAAANKFGYVTTLDFKTRRQHDVEGIYFYITELGINHIVKKIIKSRVDLCVCPSYKTYVKPRYLNQQHRRR